MEGQIETHFLYLSKAKYPLVHRSEHSIVKGSLYKFGLAGQTDTHDLVEGSLNSFAEVLQVSVHVLVVLSA